ncbi:XdhC/CoxI family protein [Ensifer sp. NM-2]|uniref:XdhC family protein n=1 Tax=Ensifer sp. NM-2 TaxID=2109730 RepID=UPI000D13E933|nr:XdhC family protein [Ensifer sp. NM-2]PSS61911.1 XdhC/CoxI family protein [Ensifer sp. NM-2]
MQPTDDNSTTWSSDLETDPLRIAETWYQTGRHVAVATVFKTWGSAPRPVGSHLVIDERGNFEGSVSGGCVEGAVIAEAPEVIATGKARLLEFGVEDETAWRVGLSCGGRIEIYLQRLSIATLRQLNQARMKREIALTVTALATGESQIVHLGDPRPPAWQDAISKSLHTGKAATFEAVGEAYFVNPYIPPPRIMIIGAVHISQALARMAEIAGFEVTVIDPRAAFAAHDRFEGIEMICAWPEDVLLQRRLDRTTALVAVTHDAKVDEEAIRAALETDCFYVGALGSRKTHASRVERLMAAGVQRTDLEKIRAPIGIDIGAETPQEIAVAILAEVIAALHRRDAPIDRGVPR